MADAAKSRKIAGVFSFSVSLSSEVETGSITSIATGVVTSSSAVSPTR